MFWKEKRRTMLTYLDAKPRVTWRLLVQWDGWHYCEDFQRTGFHCWFSSDSEYSNSSGNRTIDLVSKFPSICLGFWYRCRELPLKIEKWREDDREDRDIWVTQPSKLHIMRVDAIVMQIVTAVLYRSGDWSMANTMVMPTLWLCSVRIRTLEICVIF